MSTDRSRVMYLETGAFVTSRWSLRNRLASVELDYFVIAGATEVELCTEVELLGTTVSGCERCTESEVGRSAEEEERFQLHGWMGGKCLFGS